MRNCTNIKFYCRPSKMDKNGLAPIELSILINGCRKFINCSLKCSPIEFGKKKRPQYIAQYIDTMRVNVATILTELATNGIPLTTERVREYMRTGGIKTYTIETLFDEYFELLEKRVGVDLSESVFKKYVTIREYFFQHIDKNKECTSITPAVIQSFQANLNKTHQLSSTCGMLTKLKTIIKYGMDNDHIKVNPFQGVKIAKGSKPITYLSEEEIDYLCKAELSNKSLQRVLDAFIIMCGTGLSYADYSRLELTDIQEMNGTHYIVKNRKKTNQEFTSIILPFAVEKIKRYDKLPVISAQKTNTYLHTIEEILGMKQPLHNHLARHSYATMLLNRHVPLSTVAKCIGDNINTTKTYYAKLHHSTIIDEVSSAFNFK